MPFKPRISTRAKITLFTCKRCGLRYSNPFKHVCKRGSLRTMKDRKDIERWKDFNAGRGMGERVPGALSQDLGTRFVERLNKEK
jgi:hypothetical protein